MKAKETQNMTVRKSLSIQLTTLEPFRIGGKQDPLSEADNPVAVVGGRVCIPGPSFKGAFRYETERFLIDSHYNPAKAQWPSDKAEMKPCIPGTPSPDEKKLIRKGMYRDRPCEYLGKKREGGYPPNRQTICPVCYLFGAQGLSGFVKVPFLFSDSSYQDLYSARLDRFSGTVVHGTNRPYQLIPPNSVFKGSVEVLLSDKMLGWELGEPRPLAESQGDLWLENNSDWDRERIIRELIVDRLQAIDMLGGYRSKGFGRVKIEVVER